MDGEPGSLRKLTYSIAVEVGIVLVILGLVATWRFTPPPRVLALADAKPAHTHIHTAQAMADLTFRPGHDGVVEAEILFMTGDFRDLAAKEVQLTLENKLAGVEAIFRPANKGSDGVWRIKQLPIPSGGRWSVQLDVLIDDFKKITLEDRIDIRAR